MEWFGDDVGDSDRSAMDDCVIVTFFDFIAAEPAINDGAIVCLTGLIDSIMNKHQKY